ncbi:MAG: hypothetical protein LBI05_08400 [Planctomycetaceae bacterium]|jgi:hypothetical protein|nr:hypothetical protein [Planctomycetaceae bacterium]
MTKNTKISSITIGTVPVMTVLVMVAFSAFAPTQELRDVKRHDFLYAGEAKIHRMYMVKGGEIVWRYHNPDSKGEISDACLMDDGNILFAHQYGVTEITRDQKVVWSIATPEGTEIHTAQPIGKEHVVYVQNGRPAKVIVMHIPSKEIKCEFVVPSREGVHGQFRNARLTSKGTLLAAHMDFGKVCEYNSQGKELWSVEVPGAWAVMPLKDENVLISSNRGFAKEVNRKGETVWEVDLRGNPDYKVQDVQTAYRLANGNTIVNNWFNQWSQNTLDLANPPLQAVELTPDKKVVWELCWWKTPDELGPSTIIQPLNEPVIRGKMTFGEFK